MVRAMTTIRAFTVITAVITALASASVALADTPKAPADKKADKAPDKAAPAAPAAPDKPGKKESMSNADAEKFLAFFEKLIAIVVANQDDCAKMATAVNGHVDANQALIKEANDAKNKGKDLPPAVKEKLEKKAKEELQPAITKKCVNDKAVQAAFMRMGPGNK